MTTTRTDAELIDTMLEDYREQLDAKSLEAFTEWQRRKLGRMFPLSAKQSAWVKGEAERLGIQTRGAENVFSKLSKKEQARQKTEAAGILPWERGADWTPPSQPRPQITVAPDEMPRPMHGK